MVNVIIPIVKDLQNYQKMIQQLSAYIDVNIIVGVTEQISKQIVDLEKSKVIVFKNDTNKEQMINSLSMFVLGGKILILRRVLQKEDLEKFLFSNESVLLASSKKRSKVANFFVKLWHKMVRLIFGVAFYEGDTSAIMFSQDLSEVLIQTGNLSYNSRVNRWKGITEQNVEVKGENKEKYPGDKKEKLVYSLSASILLALAIIITVLLCVFVNINFILGLLIVCIDIIFVFISIVLFMMLAFNNKVGAKNIAEGEIISNLKESETK